MKIEGFDFGVTDWSKVEKTCHPGQEGKAYWQTISVGGMRLRHVEYSPGHLADHWCDKGRVMVVLDGEFVTD